MATQTVKAILLLSICLSAFAGQDEKFTRIQGPCDLTEQQKVVAWGNVLEVLTEKYPGLSKYCETELVVSTNKFIIVNGVCRTYVSCVKTVDGEDILRGDFIVELDESTQEVRGVLDATWEAKP